MAMEHKEITEAIIGAAFEVHTVMGYGFIEGVYKRAMQAELIRHGHEAQVEPEVKVYYKGIIVGDYRADLLVDKLVIVEIKSAKKYNPAHEPQLLNELKATKMEVGLLINFGERKVEFKRFVYQKY